MSPLARHRVSSADRAPPAAAQVALVNDTRGLAFAVILALVIATFEGPVRYGLNVLHLDALIFVRDAAIMVALALFVAARLAVNAVPVSLGVFALLALVHGLVAFVNIGSAIPAIYGLKMFLPALCGFLAAGTLTRPGRGLVGLIAVMWVAAAIGATVDKFWLDYPWVGLNVELGGVKVYIGRDWQSGEIERVGGLARSSINLAVLMPLLSFMLLTRLKNRVLVTLVCTVTFAVLVWTTQKGAIFGYGLAVLALLLSSRGSSAPLKGTVLLAAVFMVFAPTVLIHFDMPNDRGVFSFQSLIERIREMWPHAWAWIGKFPPFLGVGLGGIGGGQRFFAPDDFNPSDNLFIYLFGNFGVASLVYLAAAVLVAMSAEIRDPRRDGLALASMVFLLTYGLVISLIEDPIASMWMGATIGWLASLQPARRSPIARERVAAAPGRWAP